MKGAEVMEPVRLLLKNLEDSIIQIGYVGENNHIQVQIDCAEVFEKYPEAIVSMAVSNPLGQTYPAIVENEGDDVLWTVTSSDVSCEGDGKIQLTFINGEEVIKTATGKTRIKNSIVGNGPAPDPIVDFVTRADAVLAEIPDAIDSALEEAKESGEFDGPPGYTPQKGVDYTDGQDGVSPTVTVTDITGGHRVVITDAEGPHSFDVMDGQGGGTVTVDDELSDTSTNPVQNKVITEEVTSLKEAITNIDPYGILPRAIVDIPVLNIVSGKYINKSGGENTSSSYTCSDFIEYDYNVLSYITYNGTIYGEVSCAFYDENKIPVFILTPDNASQYGITPVRAVKSITVPVPANTRYVRISYLGTATSALFGLKTVFLGKQEKLPESYLQGEDVTLVIGEYTSNKVLVNGVETAYSYSGKYITDYLPVTPNGYYMITGSADSGNDYYAFYDANKTFISSKKSNTSNSAVINELVKIPSNVAYVRVACKTSCSWCVLGACGSVTIKRKPDNTWHKRFMNIGYSSINVCPANTSETFRSVCRFGFNACKGDVEITSDGKLVMCHDSGFTFDGNGRITTYNSENNTLIADLTYAECLQKEYANQSFMLDYAHVCGFDEYLDICSEFGVTAVVTIRGTRKDDVAKVVVEKLKAHNLLDNCLVNSYNIDALSIVHMLDSNIPMTLVLSTNTFPVETQIANAKKYGNMGFVGVFSGDNKQTLIESNATIIKALNDSNVGFIYAQTSAVSEIDFARKHGFCGAHILAPVVPYQMKETKFKVKILNGTPTIDWWAGQDLFTATISATGNVISVSNFKKQGSTSLYNDEIMEVWMNRMPYRITVRSAYNRNVSAVWEDNTLKITTTDITQYDVLTVIIEV